VTLSEIARRIEEIRPGSLPKSLFVNYGELRLVWSRCVEPDGTTSAASVPLPDDIARATLGWAMVMAMRAKRDSCGWIILAHQPPDGWCDQHFADLDHGNDPLRSLLAAFERVYAKEDKC